MYEYSAHTCVIKLHANCIPEWISAHIHISVQTSLAIHIILRTQHFKFTFRQTLASYFKEQKLSSKHLKVTVLLRTFFVC